MDIGAVVRPAGHLLDAVDPCDRRHWQCAHDCPPAARSARTTARRESSIL
jgi:hypothetical protein